MHYPVFDHKATLSFAFLVCIILYIEGKQFRCSVFTFVQYNFSVVVMNLAHFPHNENNSNLYSGP